MWKRTVAYGLLMILNSCTTLGKVGEQAGEVVGALVILPVIFPLAFILEGFSSMQHNVATMEEEKKVRELNKELAGLEYELLQDVTIAVWGSNASIVYKCENNESAVKKGQIPLNRGAKLKIKCIERFQYPRILLEIQEEGSSYSIVEASRLFVEGVPDPEYLVLCSSKEQLDPIVVEGSQS